MLPARFDDSQPPGLLHDVITVDLRRYTPAQFASLVAAKLADMGIGASAVAGTDWARAVRVSESDLRRLGVHAAISVEGVSDEGLPDYVPRDADTAGSGVRTTIAAAAGCQGLRRYRGGTRSRRGL